jgi:hypothetical protein
MPRDIIFNEDLGDDEAFVGGYKIRGADTMKWLLGGGSQKRSAKAAREGPHIPPASYAESETGKVGNGGQARYTTEASEQSPLLQGAAGDPTNDTSAPRGIPLIGSGVATFWHTWQLSRMGRGVDPDVRMSWLFGGVLWEMVVCGIAGAVIGMFKS